MPKLNSSVPSNLRRLLTAAARRRTLAALAVTALLTAAALSLAAAGSNAADNRDFIGSMRSFLGLDIGASLGAQSSEWGNPFRKELFGPSSASLVVSQAYGGGGNSSASYQNDFIEIFNPTASGVSVNGWSVQQASSTGSTWNVTNLPNVTVGAGKYLLIQGASGGAVGSVLPTPDATGTFNLAAATGKVALVSNTTTLSGTCPTGGAIVDFLGYGTGTNCSETTIATGPSGNVNSVTRGGGGCTDTDNNSSDFAVAAANPRNSATAANSCTATASIAISSAHPATGNINQNSTNNILGSIQLDVTSAGTTLTGLTVTTAGTYQTTDLLANSFKFWINSSNNLTGATQLGSGQAIVASGNTVGVSGLSQSISAATTRYVLVTADVAYNAVNGRTISLTSTPFSSITFNGTPTKTGTDPVAGSNTQTIQTVTPSIAITGLGPSAGNVSKGSVKAPIDQLSFAVTSNATDLNSVTFNTAGTYAPADLSSNSLKLWYNTSNNLGTATQLGSSQAVVSSGGSVTFSGLTQKINSGATGFVWLTVDVAASATVNNTISATTTPFSNITFSAGNKTGTDPAAASGDQTIADLTANTDFFRSNVATGDWSTPGSWQSSHDGSTNWITATASPDNNSSGVQIRSGHNITVSTSITTDDTTVDSGGQITVSSSGTLIIADGAAATDLTVNGTIVNSNAITTTGAVSFGSGSTYEHARNSGTIPTATWNANSTVLVSGTTTTAPTFNSATTYGNVTWNCPSQGTAALNLSGGLINIAGNFTMVSTGGSTGETRFLGTATGVTVSIGGNLAIQGGNLVFSNGSAGTSTLSLGGSYNQSGGTFDGNSSTSMTFTFTGTGKTFTQSAGTFANASKINWAVNAGASLSLNNNLPVSTGRTVTVNGTLNTGTSAVTGAGAFTLGATGNLGLGSVDGLSTTASTGNIQSTGTRTYTAGSTFVYNGSANQAVGNGLPASVTNLTIANTGSNPTNIVTGNSGQTVTGLLRVQSGVYSSASTYNNVQIDAGATLSAAADINVTGDWTNGGTFTHNSFGVTFSGTGAQNITAGGTGTGKQFAGFTINKATGIATLTGGLTAATLTLTTSPQVNFTAGATTTATTSLSMNGTAGNLVLLRSTSSGTQWKLVAPATQSVSYVDVQDSDASGGNTVASTHTTNTGNNTNWTFQNTVTFDGNGSTGGSMSPQVSSVTANLTANAFTKTGNSFAGWNTQPGGGGTAYANQASYNFAADVTLYARWTVNNYTLSYNANGGTGTDPASSSVAYNSSTTTAANPYTRAGFSMTGWNTAADGSGTHANAGGSFTMPASNTTLYAEWKGTVTYNGNNATGGTAPTDGSSPYFAGATVTVSTNSGSLVRSGYTFAGWNTQAGGGGTDYAASGSATFTMAGDITLYAKWTNDTAPSISYTPIPNTTSTTNPTVVVTASDADGITDMKIFSKIGGGSFNAGDACSLATGTSTSGTWNCTIGGSLTSPSAISYYVTATDASTATAINPVGGAMEPNLYTIGAAAVPAGSYSSISLSDGASLGGNILVTGTLTLGGTVTTGSNTLELGCSATVSGAGGYDYVVGNVKKDFCSGGTFSFPIGTTPNGSRPAFVATNVTERDAPDGSPNPPEYTPLSMTVNSGTFPAAVTVAVTDATMSGLDPAKSVSRYWDVSVSGGPINADMTFNYLAGTMDVPVTATEGDFKVYKNDGATITEVTSTAGTQSKTVANVTSFSKWGIGILAPTAAPAVVSGRVVTWDGRGIQNAIITATDLSGQSVGTVITGPFGYYSVGGLEVGQTYVLTVSSKRYRFASPSRIVGLVDDVAGFDFVANP